MIERVLYYIDLLITFCGFDGRNDNLYFGWFIIIVSIILVIYAFYQAINKTISPGEQDIAHIKYQIFDEPELNKFKIEEIDHAN